MIERYREELEDLRQRGMLRRLTPLSGRQGCRSELGGREMLNLSSNDYLGLGGDGELLARFYQGLGQEGCAERYALGTASSRLLSGDTHTAHRLEERLAEAFVRESCLLFNSGYHANIGILPALFGRGDAIFSDKLNHASIVDGMRLSTAEHRRYRHLDYDQLDLMLTRERRRYRQAVIVSESVFSMDGDVADLHRLVDLKRRHNCLLYLDEAHAVGVYGKRGLGQAEAQERLAEVDLLVGTFGKAWASVGAFVLLHGVLRDYLLNHSRSLIFTTALPPVVLSWNLFILEQLATFAHRREKLAMLSSRLRQRLGARGLCPAGDTNILPVMIGAAEKAVRLAEEMRRLGYLVLPIRPPTVPEGTCRFRLSLTAAMNEEELDRLADALHGLLSAATPGGGALS